MVLRFLAITLGIWTALGTDAQAEPCLEGDCVGEDVDAAALLQQGGYKAIDTARSAAPEVDFEALAQAVATCVGVLQCPKGLTNSSNDAVECVGKSSLVSGMFDRRRRTQGAVSQRRRHAAWPLAEVVTKLIRWLVAEAWASICHVVEVCQKSKDIVEIMPHKPMYGFDPALAKNFYLYTTAATCTMEQLQAWPKQFTSDLCVALPATKVLPFEGQGGGDGPLSQKNKRGLVAVEEGTKSIIVTIAGTGLPSDPGFFLDVLADAWTGISPRHCTIEGTTLPGIYHEGFCIYYKHTLERSDYLKHLKTALSEYPDYTLYFVGHSLGGAAISIAAVDALFRLKLAKPENTILYTFGQPREGSPESANYLNTHIQAAWRVTNQGDIVPQLAPCCPEPNATGQLACKPHPIMPFHHGKEAFYDYPDPVGPVPVVKTCNGYGEDPEGSDGAFPEQPSLWTKYILRALYTLAGPAHTTYMGVDLDKWCCT